MAQLALHGDCAAHHFCEVLVDAQAQTGSAVSARCGGISLIELIKYFLKFCLFNTYACVFDSQPDHGFSLRIFDHVDIQKDVAGLSKLDCVVAEIEQDLAHAPRITAYAGWTSGAITEEEFQVFLLGTKGHQLGDFFSIDLEIECDMFKLHFPGFDFREVQNVVDDLHQ